MRVFKLHIRDNRERLRSRLCRRPASHPVGLRARRTAMLSGARGQHCCRRGLCSGVDGAERRSFAIVSGGQQLGDLYVPINSPVSMYRGMDNGLFAVQLDSAADGPVLVFSASLSTHCSDILCSGDLRIDLTTGRATQANGGAMPYYADLYWAGCLVHLPFDRPDPSVASKNFDRASSPTEAAPLLWSTNAVEWCCELFSRSDK